MPLSDVFFLFFLGGKQSATSLTRRSLLAGATVGSSKHAHVNGGVIDSKKKSEGGRDSDGGADDYADDVSGMWGFLAVA